MRFWQIGKQTATLNFRLQALQLQQPIQLQFFRLTRYSSLLYIERGTLSTLSRQTNSSAGGSSGDGSWHLSTDDIYADKPPHFVLLYYLSVLDLICYGLNYLLINC